MDILKQYDQYLTTNLDEIECVLVDDNPIYRDIDCDYSNYMNDLYKYSITLFMDSGYTNPHLIDGLKRTFNNNANVINKYNSVKQLIIEHKLNAINSDFQ